MHQQVNNGFDLVRQQKAELFGVASMPASPLNTTDIATPPSRKRTFSSLAQCGFKETKRRRPGLDDLARAAALQRAKDRPRQIKKKAETLKWISYNETQAEANQVTRKLELDYNSDTDKGDEEEETTPALYL